MSSTVGPVASPRRRRSAVETVPSMPLAPRLASTRGGASRAGKNVSRSRTGIEEATTSVASGGSAAPSSRGDPRLGQPGGAESARAIAPRRRRSARVPALEPAAVAARFSRSPSASSARAGRRRGSSRRRRPGPARRPRGRSATCSASSRPREPAAQRLGGRQVADAEDEVGRVRGGPARGRAAARRSGRSRPGRGGRRTAGRRAAGSRPAAAKPASAAPAPGRARRGRRRSPRAGAPASSSRAPSTSAGGGSAAIGGRVTHGRPPARPPVSSSGSGSSSTSGSRSAKFRCTGPGRPSSAVQTARQASWRSQRSRSGVAGASSTSRNHLAARAVELDLVDRLAGADVAQLGRPVGGEDEQRDARLVGLDHRGRVVGGRGARRAGEHRRACRSPSRARARRTPPLRSSMCEVARIRGSRASDEHERRRARARATCTASRTPQRASSSHERAQARGRCRSASSA